MLAYQSFITTNRQGYIDAGVRAANSLREDFNASASLCLGIQGPNSSGKSLFLDALIHELVDGLDPNNVPKSDHMMLEDRQDQANGYELIQRFTIAKNKRDIGFVNMPRIDSSTLRILKYGRFSHLPKLSLFSFQHLLDVTVKDLFDNLPLTDLYKINDSGSGLNRQWTLWCTHAP